MINNNSLASKALKVFQAHNKVINKFFRERIEPSLIGEINSFRDYVVNLWALHICYIQHNLTKMYFLYHGVDQEG